MNKGEQKFWRNDLQEQLKQIGAASRVENGAGIGTPDVHIIINGQCHWIELKYTTIDEGKVTLRPSQKMWQKLCRNHGYQTAVLTRVDCSTRPAQYMLNRSEVPVYTDKLEVWAWSADVVWNKNIDMFELKEYLLHGAQK